MIRRQASCDYSWEVLSGHLRRLGIMRYDLMSNDLILSLAFDLTITFFTSKRLRPRSGFIPFQSHSMPSLSAEAYHR